MLQGGAWQMAPWRAKVPLLVQQSAVPTPTPGDHRSVTVTRRELEIDRFFQSSVLRGQSNHERLESGTTKKMKEHHLHMMIFHDFSTSSCSLELGFYVLGKLCSFLGSTARTPGRCRCFLHRERVFWDHQTRMEQNDAYIHIYILLNIFIYCYGHPLRI